MVELLFRKATTEGPQRVMAAIFWMKTRGGWRERPQQHQVAFAAADLGQLIDEELEYIILSCRDEFEKTEGSTRTSSLTLTPVNGKSARALVGKALATSRRHQCGRSPVVAQWHHSD